jgi:hypothetical protein
MTEVAVPSELFRASMKTTETTEEDSSDGIEKRVERRKYQRSAPFAGEKPGADWK